MSDAEAAAEAKARGNVRLLRGRGGGASEYLDVKHRLVWLRDVHPDATIETTHIELTEQRAIFRAVVALPNHAGVATGYGSETKSDFGDFIEKAETKAIGRALAALGFGTQFLVDQDQRIVDSPIERRPTGELVDRTTGEILPGAKTAPRSGPHNAGQAITDKQIDFIESVARESGMTDDDLHAATRRLYNADRYDGLSRREASAFIEHLQTARASVGPVAATGGATEPVEPPPSTITTDQRRRLEGMVKERGGDHDMLRDIGQALFLKGTTTAWTPEEGDRVSRWIGPYDATGWGIAWEYARKLLQAKTTDALSAVANELGAAGVSDHELRAIYKRKKESFEKPASPGQLAGMPTPVNQASDDKYTQ